MKKLLMFDTNAVMHHVFHGYRKSATYMKDGTPNYMLKGFCNYIANAIERQKSDYVVFVFDPSGPTFRHEIYPAYKANRPPKDPEFKIQEAFIKEYLSMTGYPVITLAGFEGDDTLATIAVRASKSAHFSDIVIYTGDKDIFQILDEKITIFNINTKELVNCYNLLEHFEVSHDNVIDYLTLLGDSADNVKGVNGCGKITAMRLINRFETLENIRDAVNTHTHKDLEIKLNYFNSIKEHFNNDYASIELSRYLITLRTDIDFELSTKTISRSYFDEDIMYGYLVSKELKMPR